MQACASKRISRNETKTTTTFKYAEITLKNCTKLWYFVGSFLIIYDRFDAFFSIQIFAHVLSGRQCLWLLKQLRSSAINFRNRTIVRLRYLPWCLSQKNNDFWNQNKSLSFLQSVSLSLSFSLSLTLLDSVIPCVCLSNISGLSVYCST